jgi:hypothetical protein
VAASIKVRPIGAALSWIGRSKVTGYCHIDCLDSIASRILTALTITSGCRGTTLQSEKKLPKASSRI